MIEHTPGQHSEQRKPGCGFSAKKPTNPMTTAYNIIVRPTAGMIHQTHNVIHLGHDLIQINTFCCKSIQYHSFCVYSLKTISGIDSKRGNHRVLNSKYVVIFILH